MAQAGFESVSARRRLKAAGFDAEQAEAVVETVFEVNVTIQQVADDLAELKTYVHENMATRKDLERFATKEELKEFATRSDLERFATKEDLKEFATKEDLKEFATKEDLKEFVKTGDFRAEIAELKADLMRSGFVATGLMVTLMLGLASMIAVLAIKI